MQALDDLLAEVMLDLLRQKQKEFPLAYNRILEDRRKLEYKFPPTSINGRQIIWRLWHFFDVDATLGVASTVFDLKYFEWGGDSPAQVHHTMDVWRTLKRRIRDPGDNSFMMAFRVALGSSKISAFQLALLDFNRPENADTPRRSLDFLEKGVDN